MYYTVIKQLMVDSMTRVVLVSMQVFLSVILECVVANISKIAEGVSYANFDLDLLTPIVFYLN